MIVLVAVVAVASVGAQEDRTGGASCHLASSVETPRSASWSQPAKATQLADAATNMAKLKALHVVLPVAGGVGQTAFGGRGTERSTC